ncbi:MAG: hypothetical protein Salg2KO_10210 [Salibacteraceae bacterium]
MYTKALTDDERKQLEELVLDKFPDIQPQTAKKHVQKFVRVMKGTGWDYSVDAMVKYALDNVKISDQQTSLLNGVRRVLTTLGMDELSAGIDKAIADIRANRPAYEPPRGQKKAPSKKERAELIVDTDISKRKKITSKMDYMTQIFLRLLDEFEPLRNGDYRTTRIDGVGPNTLNLKTGKWVLGKRKSNKDGEKTILKVSKPTLKLIKAFHKAYPDNPPYIFVQRNGNKPMSSQNFSKFTDQTLKTNATALRRQRGSEVQDKGLPANERTRIAKEMGHSVETQSRVYTRDSLALHGSLEDIVKKAVDTVGEERVRGVLLALT